MWVSSRLSVKSLVLAVGGLSLVVVVVLMWIAVSRCRAAAAARQSNLEDKTARSLTKSNSYKSSPSGTAIAIRSNSLFNYRASLCLRRHRHAQLLEFAVSLV